MMPENSHSNSRFRKSSGAIPKRKIGDNVGVSTSDSSSSDTETKKVSTRVSSLKGASSKGKDDKNNAGEEWSLKHVPLPQTDFSSSPDSLTDTGMPSLLGSPSSDVEVERPISPRFARLLGSRPTSSDEAERPISASTSIGSQLSEKSPLKISFKFNRIFTTFLQKLNLRTNKTKNAKRIENIQESLSKNGKSGHARSEFDSDKDEYDTALSGSSDSADEQSELLFPSTKMSSGSQINIETSERNEDVIPTSLSNIPLRPTSPSTDSTSSTDVDRLTGVNNFTLMSSPPSPSEIMQRIRAVFKAEDFSENVARFIKSRQLAEDLSGIPEEDGNDAAGRSSVVRQDLNLPASNNSENIPRKLPPKSRKSLKILPGNSSEETTDDYLVVNPRKSTLNFPLVGEKSNRFARTSPLKSPKFETNLPEIPEEEEFAFDNYDVARRRLDLNLSLPDEVSENTDRKSQMKKWSSLKHIPEPEEEEEDVPTSSTTAKSSEDLDLSLSDETESLLGKSQLKCSKSVECNGSESKPHKKKKHLTRKPKMSSDSGSNESEEETTSSSSKRRRKKFVRISCNLPKYGRKRHHYVPLVPSPSLTSSKSSAETSKLLVPPKKLLKEKDKSSSLTQKKKYIFKVVVVGERGVGKTSLIMRLAKDIFSDKYIITPGVDYTLVKYKWDQETTVHIQFWDLGGELQNVTRIYYRYAAGALVIFDMTRYETFIETIRWKIDIDSKVQLLNGSKIPSLLLANKCDSKEVNIARHYEGMKKYCEVRGFCGWFDTSAKNNTNIKDAMLFLMTKMMENASETGLQPSERQSDIRIVLKDEVGQQSNTCLCFT